MINRIQATIFTIFTIALFLLGSGFLNTTKAADLQDAFKTGGENGEDPLNQAAGQAGYDVSQTSVNPIIETIIQVALSFLGVIFLILTIYGGFLWMTASGNEDQVGKAKRILTAAIIGLIVVVAAYALSTLVISRLGGSALE